MSNLLTLNKDDASRILNALDGNKEDIKWSKDRFFKFIEKHNITSSIAKAIEEWMRKCLEEAWDTDRFKHIKDYYMEFSTKENAFHHYLHNMLEGSYSPIFDYKDSELTRNKYCQYHMQFPAKDEQKEELLNFVRNYLKTNYIKSPLD